MAVLATSLTSASGGLRPLDERRDLNAIADLVEMCFSDSMDPDGRRYIRDLRMTARTAGFWQVMGAFADSNLNSAAGYVWEEGDRVVGNVSLFPFQSQGHRCYLIANVAVHPDHRSRGIGRALTSAGINFARSRNAQAIWLHVRADNGPAVHIYQSLGFLERTRRTTWHARSEPYERRLATSGNLSILPRTTTHWSQQREWLRRIYPPEYSWHLRVNWKALQPGLNGSLYRLMNITFPRQWTVQRNGTLLGVLTWQRTIGQTDNLWLAIPEQFDEAAVRELLVTSRRQLSVQRTARLNLPAGLVSAELLETGFEVSHTLLWMEYRLGF